MTLPTLPPRRPGRPHRRGAALLLTLAVLAAHAAMLGARPSPWPPSPSPAAQPLRLRLTAVHAPGPTRAATPAATSARRSAPAPRERPAMPSVAQEGSGAAPGPPAETVSSPVATTPEPSEADAAPPWPRYRAALPPAATRHYRLQRGGKSAAARLVWTHDAQGYELSLMAEGGELDGLGAASRGRVGPDGLVPQRHVERRRGRDLRATNFDLATAQLRGSGGGEPHPWPTGGQDRLSWLLQLAAVMQADPRLAQPGARVLLPVAGPRGPASAWVFTVRGPEALTLADGRSVPGVALQRTAQHPYDLQVEVWLDPADHHLPLRLRLSAPPGEWESVWLSLPAS